jgi:hypothetical protein
MVRILTDEEAERDDIDNHFEEPKKVIDVESHVHRHTIKLTPARIEQFCGEFNEVVVNDFGDEYHLTEEEREAQNQFYAAFRVVRKLKKVYRNAVKYVEAMREILKCLDIIAERNGVYEPEKFKMMYFKGKIEIYGLQFPRFKGPEKKMIDSRYLMEFILGDDPAYMIDPRYVDESETKYEDLPLEERLKRWNPEHLKLIETPLDHRFETEYFDPDEDDPDGTNVVPYLTEKEYKKLCKIDEFKDVMGMVERRLSLKDNLESAIRQNFVSDEFDKIAQYDKKHGYKSKDDFPEFHGDLTDKYGRTSKAFKRWERDVEKWEKKHNLVNYYGKMITEEEHEDIILREMIEDAGMNSKAFVTLFGYASADAKNKTSKRKNSKKERDKDNRKSDIRLNELKYKLMSKEDRKRYGDELKKQIKKSKAKLKDSDKKGKKKGKGKYGGFSSKEALDNAIDKSYKKTSKKFEKELAKGDRKKLSKKERKELKKLEKKANKKGKKKDKKKERKEFERQIKRQEVVNRVKEDTMDNFNTAVLKETGHSSFKDWEDDCLDMTGLHDKFMASRGEK